MSKSFQKNWEKFLLEAHMSDAEFQERGRQIALKRIEQLFADLSQRGYTEAAEELLEVQLRLRGYNTTDLA